MKENIQEKDMKTIWNHLIVKFYNDKPSREKEFWEYCIRIGYTGSKEDALKIVTK